MTALEELSRGAQAALGRRLTAKEHESFDKYLTLLLKWQRAHRLVGSDDPMWIVEHLFLDSLLFLKLLPASCRKLADVGSGAGLPGLPIKIVRSDLEVVLIESRRRRAMFLTSAVREMRLAGVRVLEGRIENLPRELAGSFDAAVMRCAGGIEEMIPVAAVLVADSGNHTVRRIDAGRKVSTVLGRAGQPGNSFGSAPGGLDMPRSLALCVNEVVHNLRLVANEQSGETLRCAGRLRADLQFGRIDEILATGRHAYLTQFLDRIGDVGYGISRDFLVPVKH